MNRKQEKTGGGKQIKKTTKVAIVVSAYNSDITYPLRDGAYKTLLEAGIQEKNIFIVEAPGAFEIPLCAKKVIKEKKVLGVIAVGCVIRGDTDHYVFISGESTRGIMDVMLSEETPIANAILTVDTLEQALVRSTGMMNKGIEAAEALLRMM